MEAPWTQTPNQVLGYYSVDAGRGLSEKQVAEHALKYGKNGEYSFHLTSFLWWCHSVWLTAIVATFEHQPSWQKPDPSGKYWQIARQA